MKKVILFTTLILLVTILASCTFKNLETTATEIIELPTEQQVVVTEETTRKYAQPIIVETEEIPKGVTKHKIGSFINLYYDDYYCEVSYHVDQTSSRYYNQVEVISINISMKNGYYFSGLYKDNFNEENLVSVYEYSVMSANKEVNIYINYSIKVLYFVNSIEYLTGFYSVANKTNIGMIDPEIYSQPGYELVGYKVGNKIYNFSDSFPTDKPTINVDCVWEKVTPSNEGSTLRTS